MKRRLASSVLTLLLIFMLVPVILRPAVASVVAAPANDDASQSPYSDGWQTGDNGGTGMGAWTLSTTSGDGNQNGHFIANNDANCNIAVGSKCWGMYANSNQTADAVRTFNSAMSVGEVFTIFMDNGSIQTGGTVGFGLRNSSDNNVLEFYFVGGQTNYKIAEGGGEKDSGVSFSNTGLKIEITLTSSATYYMVITKLSDNSVKRYAGPLQNPTGGQTIDRLRLFNFNAGSGSSNNAYFNSISAASAPTVGSLVINEIDYDNLSTDDAEFIEIKNTGAVTVSLAGYHVALLQGNGADPIIRTTIDLPSYSLPAGGYYVLCGDAANVPNCNLDVTPNTNLLENDKDGVALVYGGTIVDSVSYEGDVAAPFTEGTGVSTSKADRNDYSYDSLSRIADGTDTNNNNNDFQRVCGTPGLTNVNSTACGAYVANTGTDTNNSCGIPTQPCVTVGRGIARAGNSETINVAGGIYNESPVVDGGTLSHWAAGGGGNDWRFNDLTINSGATVNAPPGTLTLWGGAADNPNFTNAGTFNAGSGSQTVAFAGQNNINGRVWGPTATTFNNVTILYNGSGTGNTDVFGVDFYDQDAPAARATINGVLTLNTRTFVAHAEIGRNNSNPSPCPGGSGYDRSCGTPNYGPNATLKYNDLEYPEGEPTACPGTNGTAPFQVFGEWLSQAAQPGVPGNVTIAADSWASLYCNAGSYRINGNLTVEAGQDGNSYGGSGTTPAGFEQNGFNLGTIGASTLTLAAGKDVSNNGTLKQSGTPGSGTTAFVNIKDANSADLYYGVDIAGGSDLGLTTVKVSGYQSTCPYWGTEPTFRIVKRCYYIAPTNAGAVQVTFYYEHGELNGFDPDKLYVWRDNGDGTWTQIAPTSRSACASGINCSVTVAALSLAGGANRYVISGGSPLAVSLASFTAAVTPDGVTLAWETVNETDNVGFNVYRTDSSLAARGDGGLAADPLRMTTSEAGAEWVKLNPALIPAAAPGSAEGHAYTWTDATAQPGLTYWYLLEDVALDGTATQHPPVQVTVGEPNAVGLAGFGATALPRIPRIERVLVLAGQVALGLIALALAASGGVALRRRR